MTKIQFLKMVQFYWEKKYSAQIFKRKQKHTQNYIDWIRNVISVQPDARILVTAISDPWDIFDFFVNAYKCLHKTLVIEKGK